MISKRLSASLLVIACISIIGCGDRAASGIEHQGNPTKFKSISGIYPHLAHYNSQGECGTGAVVPWQGDLWVMTYSPHKPLGSDDGLYQIKPDLTHIVREESIGGTPANRMIHKESKQLFMGPYAIDEQGGVRAIPYDIMPGRHTGNARHLSDPTNKIYYGTMEEGFYEVDVHTLAVDTLYLDGNLLQKKGDMVQSAGLLVGAHGKGLYSGQGVMVYSNNGEATPEALKQFDIESGVLAEWNGDSWNVIRRNQFVEVTGPGGIMGNENPDTDPIWVTGWDHKSVIVGVRSPEAWSFYRLPKASHSYDGAHGWNTEWPRIRNVGTEEQADFLMTMHGMFWHFPETFAATNSAGIRPRSSYLKVIGDFTRWNDQLVFACDDSAQREFLNKRKQKGGIEGPGQSNSNIWFTSMEQPDLLGPTTASGAVWLDEVVQAKSPSEPFLFAGWNERSAWVQNGGSDALEFMFEIDKLGTGNWETIKTVSVPKGAEEFVSFPENVKGEWIRCRTDKEARVTVSFNFANSDTRMVQANSIFDGLASVEDDKARGGLLYGLGDDRRALGIAVQDFDAKGIQDVGYYELDEALNLVPKEDKSTKDFIVEKFEIPRHVVDIDVSSVLVTDDNGRRWRFPLGPSEFGPLTESGSLRICREVATERDLFNCHGTFYELPAENADGFAKVRPVASHNFRIHDYASYRGLLVMTGIEPDMGKSEHVVRSADGKAAVWLGAIDDLWKLGKPTGLGGPWHQTKVKTGDVSDPYLIGFYDQRSLSISHDGENSIPIEIEVLPMGHGPWMSYKTVKVGSGETLNHTFPDDFEVRWIRFRSLGDCTITTLLRYE